MLGAHANAWALGVTWGETRTPNGDAIAWGVACADGATTCDGNTPWTVACDVVTPSCDPGDAVKPPAVKEDFNDSGTDGTQA
jgi:hypothetical protein